eukprot:COSAG01_NODE_16912_length_1194_cov_1.768037_2_plen_130_part_00
MAAVTHVDKLAVVELWVFVVLLAQLGAQLIELLRGHWPSPRHLGPGRREGARLAGEDTLHLLALLLGREALDGLGKESGDRLELPLVLLLGAQLLDWLGRGRFALEGRLLGWPSPWAPCHGSGGAAGVP